MNLSEHEENEENLGFLIFSLLRGRKLNIRVYIKIFSPHLFNRKKVLTIPFSEDFSHALTLQSGDLGRHNDVHNEFCHTLSLLTQPFKPTISTKYKLTSPSTAGTILFPNN